MAMDGSNVDALFETLQPGDTKAFISKIVANNQLTQYDTTMPPWP